MDAASDNDTGFQLGRRHTPSSSRESSPVAKRQKRAFTPASDDGDLVVPVAHSEDTETPTPENVPLIRQAVGFSWAPSTNATSVSTYQASVATQPVVPYFLPGQAPPPSSKRKPPRPRAPKRNRGAHFSSQTSKFKLSDSTLPSSSVPGSASLNSRSAENCFATSSSSSAAQSSARPMIPSATYNSGSANGNATAGSSNPNGTHSVASAAPSLGTKRTRSPSKKRVFASLNDSFTLQTSRPSPAQPIPVCTYSSRYSELRGSSEERGRTLDTERTRVASGYSSVEHTNEPTAATQGSTQSVLRPIRMVTLLIEDLRSGVSDPQLAEVRVPLRIADVPGDGFWADAVEVCNALQGGPSRIDGPAKVYTIRGRFRQFFMRVDHLDQYEVQPAHLGVSRDRTLNVFVEAHQPVPQGHLPRPPVQPQDMGPVHNSNTDREDLSSPSMTNYRPSYSFVTREDQIERLSRSTYARPEKTRITPVSESGSYGHSRRTTSPNAQHRMPQHDPDYYTFQRSVSPPIPGRLADTEEERDEAIANYIRSHIENHSGWMEYMQSKAKPQRVSEVLKQYTFVEDRVRELVGRKTPTYWDGAPNAYVEKQHVWRVLKLDTMWGKECQETMALVQFYGQRGSRYEDSRVIDMMNDTSPPKPNAMDRFLRLLRSVDESFTQDTLDGRFTPTPTPIAD